jgi:hypothetical protein
LLQGKTESIMMSLNLQQFLTKASIKALCFAICSIIFVGCNAPEKPVIVETPNTVVERPNAVTSFFKDAELQAETDEQRQEIKIVLLDMLNLNTNELKAKKYPDYQGHINQWDVIKFANSYFVPSSPMVLSPDTFFEDLLKPEARAVIQELINQNNIDATLNKK